MAPRPPRRRRISRKDTIIQSTDIDALSSKYSAFQRNYISEADDRFFIPFVRTLLRLSSENETSRLSPAYRGVLQQFETPKLPLINRGTFLRTHAISQLVNSFLQDASPAAPMQIISLGAGSDTRGFHTLATHPLGSVVYHEVDFPESTHVKVQVLRHLPDICDTIGWKPASEFTSPDNGSSRLGDRVSSRNAEETGPQENSIHSRNYHLHPADLRHIPGMKREQLAELFPGLSADLPTLIISECCLCYLEPEEATDVVVALAGYVSADVAFAMYDPIGLGDSFGAVMTENLAARGISLPSLQIFTTKQKQQQRVLDMLVRGCRNAAGVRFAAAVDLLDLETTWLSAEQKSWLSGLELLDEREEWDLLAKHYCIAWGFVGKCGLKVHWMEKWQQLPHKDPSDLQI